MGDGGKWVGEWHDSHSIVKIVNGIQHFQGQDRQRRQQGCFQIIQQKEIEAKSHCPNKMPLSLAKFLHVTQFSTQRPSVERKAGSHEKRTLQDQGKYFCNDSPSPSSYGSTIIYLRGSSCTGEREFLF